MDCISSIYLNRSNIPTNMNFGVTQQNGTIPQKDYSQDKFVKHLDEKKEKQKNWKDIATNLAFGALILGGIVCGVRVYSLNKAKNIMKEAFMNENISIGNARKMLREYNEIYESNEKTEDYAKALFNKVKEHFGLSETNLNLKVIPDK